MKVQQFLSIDKTQRPERGGTGTDHGKTSPEVIEERLVLTPGVAAGLPGTVARRAPTRR